MLEQIGHSKEYMTKEESLERVLNDVGSHEMWASMSAAMSFACGAVAFGAWAFVPREIAKVITPVLGLAGMGVGALSVLKMYAGFSIMHDYLRNPEELVANRYNAELVDGPLSSGYSNKTDM